MISQVLQKGIAPGPLPKGRQSTIAPRTDAAYALYMYSPPLTFSTAPVI